MARKKLISAKLSTYRAGDGTAADVAAAISESDKKGQKATPAREIVKRRAAEWEEHRIKWMRMQDAFEGGDRYRQADYGMDRKGLPVRNLFRHRREYPDPQQFTVAYQGFAAQAQGMNSSASDLAVGPYPGQVGADPGATAQDDEYELRRARTPVPEFLPEAVKLHLSK